MATTLIMNVSAANRMAPRNETPEISVFCDKTPTENGETPTVRDKLLIKKMSASSDLVIEWTDLEFSVLERKFSFVPPFIKREEKAILEPQSGFIKSGTLTALMGPSGAGKTTLLNLLTNQFKSVKGLHQNCNQELKVAFVPQKDHLFTELTVRETILIAYRFKNPRSKNSESENPENQNPENQSPENQSPENQSPENQSPDSVVVKIASDLNLISCLDTKVSNLSGGQIKRLSVGVELVSTPNVLILDEPTSGLDSTNALMILKVIKRLLNGDAKDEGAKIDRDAIKPAVICSIHQPSFACLELFDKIYLLSERGEKIFFDSPGSVPSFLASVGIKLPDQSNPGDYLLDASYLNKTPNEKSHPKFLSIGDTKCNGDANRIEVIIPDANHEKLERNEVLTENQKYFQNCSKFDEIYEFLSQIFLLLVRNVKILKSNPTPVFIRILFAFLNLNTLWMYNHSPGSHDGCWSSILAADETISVNRTVTDLLKLAKDAPDNSEFAHRMEQVNDNITLFLMMCNIVIYFNIMLTVSCIPMEVKIIQKEVTNHWYSVNAYITARMLFYLPLMTLQIIGYVSVAYVTASQIMEFKRLFIFIIVFMFLAWISEIVGIAIGAIFAGNVTASTIIAVLYTFPIILFGGYFVHEESANVILNWIMWSSQVKHLLDACVIAIYGLGRCSPLDGTAISVHELTSPKRIIERIFLDFDIDHRDAKFISPILGVPNDSCMEEVINGTRDYLGLNFDDAEYEDYGGDAIVEDASAYSYPLSLFKLNDAMLPRCFFCLTLLLILYICFAVIALKRLLKQKK